MNDLWLDSMIDRHSRLFRGEKPPVGLIDSVRQLCRALQEPEAKADVSESASPQET
jgi:hypothetical protein